MYLYSLQIKGDSNNNNKNVNASGCDLIPDIVPSISWRD
jgi:hypothetical protein